uniref:Uncharacterized protein n=1 Tax=Anguilla anguilla TaxID=7936 RepID=A0A0E9Y0K6_ANGAN
MCSTFVLISVFLAAAFACLF